MMSFAMAFLPKPLPLRTTVTIFTNPIGVQACQGSDKRAQSAFGG
jgi:hypothetical protein